MPESKHADLSQQSTQLQTYANTHPATATTAKTVTEDRSGHSRESHHGMHPRKPESDGDDLHPITRSPTKSLMSAASLPVVSNSEISQNNQDIGAEQHAPVLATKSINTVYVSERIAALKDTLPADHRPVVLNVPRTRERVNLRTPLLHILKQYFPKEGSVWEGGLMQFLRSGPVLQIVKLWAERCYDEPAGRIKLAKFLPPGDYPFKKQHKRIVELAKKTDAGATETESSDDVTTLFAIYSRKLLFCNYATFVKNSPDSIDYINYRLLDVPCAIMLTAFYDLRLVGDEGFFGKLLQSPLAKPMHGNLRTRLEKDYVLDSLLVYAKDHPAAFYTRAPRLPKGPSAGMLREAEIDGKADYRLEPFIADPAGAASHTINYDYITEVLPGRSMDEVKDFYLLNKQLLTDSPDLELHSQRSKRSRQALDDSAEVSGGDATALKKARTTIRGMEGQVDQADSIAGLGSDEKEAEVRGKSGPDPRNPRSAVQSLDNRAFDRDSLSHKKSDGEVPRGRLSRDAAYPATGADTVDGAGKVWQPLGRPDDYLGTGADFDANAARIRAGADRLNRLNSAAPAATQPRRQSVRGQAGRQRTTCRPRKPLRSEEIDMLLAFDTYEQSPIGKHLHNKVRAEQNRETEAKKACENAETTLKAKVHDLKKAHELEKASTDGSHPAMEAVKEFAEMELESAKVALQASKDKLAAVRGDLRMLQSTLVVKEKAFVNDRQRAAALRDVQPSSSSGAFADRDEEITGAAGKGAEAEDSDSADDLIAELQKAKGVSAA